MKYTISEFLPEQPFHPIEIVLELKACDWYALEKSPEWAALEAFVDNLQKRSNHGFRRHYITKMSTLRPYKWR